MPVIYAENTETRTASASSRHGAVQRTAFYLPSSSKPLLAWLHTARESLHVDHGVVICAPIGVEQLHSNRTLRHLADALATQGVPTLRFDWHGTGDSAGSDGDAARVTEWQCNVCDAIAWMRTKLQCRMVSVVGLRLGATLAVEAIGPDECENLVLWAPVACGKTHMRQMRAIELLAESRLRPSHAAPGDVEAAGFLITEETAEALAKSSLLNQQFNCRRALVVGPYDRRIIHRLEQLGVPSDSLSPPGYTEMMAEPHASQVPHQAVREIAEWLGARLVVPTAGLLTIEAEAIGTTQARVPVQSDLAATDSCEGIREQLLRIGPYDLFGVLSEPHELSDEFPTIVILNAGSANHVGPGRLYVELSRNLAGRGFRCLRLDISGLGDSICLSPDDENDPYPASVFRDVASVLQELRDRFGVTRCVLLGLCSGAYAAFQAAAQLVDPSLVESILINPLTFYWRDGLTLDASLVARQVKENSAIARATNIRKLWKFFTGKSRFGYLEAAILLLRRAQNLLQQSVSTPSRVADLRPTGDLSHPVQENLAADLNRIISAGRRLSMFLAEGDPGYAIMTFHARKLVRALQRAGVFQVVTIPGADHTFSRRVPRERLIAAVSDYLVERYSNATH